MQIVHFNLGPLETNGFLLHNKQTAVMIDPGGNPAKILTYLRNNKLELTHILNTHLHCDHTYGNAELQKKTGAFILASEQDSFLLQHGLGQGGLYGLPRNELFEFSNLNEGTALFVDEECHVLSTPGHSPGSLSYYFPSQKVIFVGDVLFYRSVGRTDFDGGDASILMQSIKDKLYTLPDETMVYPGHGLETSIAEEKAHNPFTVPY